MCGGVVLWSFLVTGRGVSFEVVLLTICGGVIVSSESEDSLLGFLVGRSARLRVMVDLLVGRSATLWVMADFLE